MATPVMDTIVIEEQIETAVEGSPHDAPSDPVAIEKPKLKGRQRILRGLQRMSSSPSLAKLSRSNSSGGYRSGGRGSISCVSLSGSMSAYGSYGSYASEMSAGYSTAPTSIPSTPGGDTYLRPRLRLGRPTTPATSALPSEFNTPGRLETAVEMEDDEGDYFSRPVTKTKVSRLRRQNFNFWADLPFEVRLQILRFLHPREIVRLSSVSKAWHSMCFDGQLWGRLDASEYYKDIPAESLVKIITSAGPFVRDLNLRGCVQLQDSRNAQGLAAACRNLENFSLEGCKIGRQPLHCFLLQNERLAHINLSGLEEASDVALRMIGEHCQKLEHLNISWCKKISVKGIKTVIQGCSKLKELRAGETSGWDDVELAKELYKRNTLERLSLMNCDSLTDDSFSAMLVGVDNEIDVLTERYIVPPRKLKHLDITCCRNLTDKSVKLLAHNAPDLEGLQLTKCSALTDESLTDVLPTLPKLTHLDLEELEELTNATLLALAASPCTSHLQHLCISYCESLGDTGMLPLLKDCPRLSVLEMDNTRISDLVLVEAASIMRNRNRLARGLTARQRPTTGMRIVAYDCSNVTWTGVREILSRNAEETRPTHPGGKSTYPSEIIQLKCFYTWQQTVEEHTKRVLRGDFAAANRLERKWAEYMILNEEAGAAGGRRRRRRAREAQMMHADEEGAGGAAGGVGGGRRRRARSGPGSCVVM